MSDEFLRPQWRWENWRQPSVSHLTLGNDRYEEGLPPLPPRNPIGFIRRPHSEPLTWEGDNA